MIPEGSRVIDVGCDHGLLDIYLSLNKNCICLASDISKKCIEKTKENIIKFGASNVTAIVSDGLKSIDYSDEIIVISGMGTSTIMDIVNGSLSNDIIIQSNNDYYEAREYFYNIGYSLKDEEVIYDKGKYYINMYFHKKNDSITLEDKFIGPIMKKKKSSIPYYQFLVNKYRKIIDDLPEKNAKIEDLKRKIAVIEKTLDQLN